MKKINFYGIYLWIVMTGTLLYSTWCVVLMGWRMFDYLWPQFDVEFDKFRTNAVYIKSFALMESENFFPERENVAEYERLKKLPDEEVTKIREQKSAEAKAIKRAPILALFAKQSWQLMITALVFLVHAFLYRREQKRM